MNKKTTKVFAKHIFKTKLVLKLYFFKIDMNNSFQYTLNGLFIKFKKINNGG